MTDFWSILNLIVAVLLLSLEMFIFDN